MCFAAINVYDSPEPVSVDDLAIMSLIDRCHLKCPFYGSRRILGWLLDEGHCLNGKRVPRLMRSIGLTALYLGRNLSKANQAHKVYLYILRNLVIDRPNQVWSTDITYIPTAKDFAYLVAVMDWYSRGLLSLRLSNTMDTAFCIDALEEATERNGVPEIFNTDQVSQFTSEDFTGVLKLNETAISLDVKRHWVDNVFVEGLWRSVKYEEVYLHGYDDIRTAKASLNRYFELYNAERKLQSLGHQAPDRLFYEAVEPMAA